MEKQLINVMLSELVPYENNPRKNDKAVHAVSESIRQTGYNNPIVVDENMVILCGHTRLKSLKKLGVKEVQVLQVKGMSEDNKKKYRLLDNKTSEYASWDYVALMEELDGLDWEELDLDWGIKGTEDLPDTEELDPFDENTEAKHKCPECGYVW